MKAIAIAVLAAGAAAGLGGCRGVYTVDVENRTPQPVMVRLLAVAPEGGAALLVAPLRLGPGDKGTLGRVETDRVRAVRVDVESAVRPGDPASLVLAPGWSIVEVWQEGTSGGSPVRARLSSR